MESLLPSLPPELGALGVVLALVVVGVFQLLKSDPSASLHRAVEKAERRANEAEERADRKDAEADLWMGRAYAAGWRPGDGDR